MPMEAIAFNFRTPPPSPFIEFGLHEVAYLLGFFKTPLDFSFPSSTRYARNQLLLASFAEGLCPISLFSPSPFISFSMDPFGWRCEDFFFFPFSNLFLFHVEPLHRQTDCLSASRFSPLMRPPHP